MQKLNDRIHWIDIAKGICMILVVLGHTMRGGPVWHAVYGFHVAAFFFLTGMTCGTGRVLTDIRRILVPYYCFGLFSIAVFAVAGRTAAALYGLPADTALMANILHLLYGNGADRAMLFNTALWFLPCLFLTKCLYYGVDRLCRGGQTLILTVCGAVGVMGYLYTRHQLPDLPFSASVAMKMLPLLALGRFCRLRGLEIRSRKAGLALGVLLMAAACALALELPKVNYSDDLFPSMAGFCATALLGTGGIILLSMGIGRNRVLEHLGRNTLAVMVMHKFPVVVLQMLQPFRNILQQNQTLTGHLLGGIPAVILSIAACLLAAMVIKKYVPALLGGK